MLTKKILLFSLCLWGHLFSTLSEEQKKIIEQINSTNDHYALFGVKSGDKKAATRKYKNWALLLHPDRIVDLDDKERTICQEAFQKINNANEKINRNSPTEDPIVDVDVLKTILDAILSANRAEKLCLTAKTTNEKDFFNKNFSRLWNVAFKLLPPSTNETKEDDFWNLISKRISMQIQLREKPINQNEWAMALLKEIKAHIDKKNYQSQTTTALTTKEFAVLKFVTLGLIGLISLSIRAAILKNIAERTIIDNDFVLKVLKILSPISELSATYQKARENGKRKEAFDLVTKILKIYDQFFDAAMIIKNEEQRQTFLILYEKILAKHILLLEQKKEPLQSLEIEQLKNYKDLQNFLKTYTVFCRAQASLWLQLKIRHPLFLCTSGCVFGFVAYKFFGKNIFQHISNFCPR